MYSLPAPTFSQIPTRFTQTAVDAYLASVLTTGPSLAFPDCSLPRHGQAESRQMCADDLKALCDLLAPAVAARGAQRAAWLRHESNGYQLTCILAKLLRLNPDGPSSMDPIMDACNEVEISNILVDVLNCATPIDLRDMREVLRAHYDAVTAIL